MDNAVTQRAGGVVATGSFVPTRDQINALEREIAALPNAVFESEPKHYFAPGLYARELFIKGGMALTGKIHRHDHLVTLIYGDATVWTDEGMKRIVGPFTWLSTAGTKRAVYTHSDCLFMTFHVTNETDLDRLEAEIIEPSDNLVGYAPAKQIEGEQS